LALLRSAGLLPYRSHSELEVMIAHPGGPYFARRDNGWWSIVKGMVEPGESDLEAALREFQEETGWDAPAQPWLELGETTLRSRKVVVAYGVEANLDPATLVPGHFKIGSRSYPEIDEVRWLTAEDAKVKLNPALGVFIDRLAAHLAAAGNNVP
jgi:predicted NUDIX family NTP pyrophosphohydrolase